MWCQGAKFIRHISQQSTKKFDQTYFFKKDDYESYALEDEVAQSSEGHEDKNIEEKVLIVFDFTESPLLLYTYTHVFIKNNYKPAMDFLQKTLFVFCRS